MTRRVAKTAAPAPDVAFNIDCTECKRLAQFLTDVRVRYPSYHARPVAPFGVAQPEVLIVGLAPGLHGANATGRPFTGDYAGVLLYQTLFDFGLATQPIGNRPDDGLKLRRARITNAVKCVPPENKPTPAEIKQCNHYLRCELNGLREGVVVLALGSIAHGAVLRAYGLKPSAAKFAHGAVHALPGERHLVDSYHCSRYNTQTKRLTPDMFADVFRRVMTLLPEARR